MTHCLQRVESLRGPQGSMYGAERRHLGNLIDGTGEGEPAGQIDLGSGELATRKLDASTWGDDEMGEYSISLTSLEPEAFNAQTADTMLADDGRADNTTFARDALLLSQDLRDAAPTVLSAPSKPSAKRPPSIATRFFPTPSARAGSTSCPALLIQA